MLKYVVGAVVFAAALFAGSPAKAASSSALVNVATGKCLDIVGGSTAPGGPSQQYDCLGDAQQLWYSEVISYRSGNLPVVRFVSVNSGLCLDIASGANAAQVIQNTCSGVTSQQWVVSAPYTLALVSGVLVAEVAPNRTLTNVATGLCLDAVAPGPNGGFIQQYTCGSGSNQRWNVNVF
jgi:endoglucanase